ncbi:MAG: hypothetical protein AAB571_05995, partial [Chloroflexota bacterium]
MSCEAHREKALQSIAAQSGSDAVQLERVFQAGKNGSVGLGYPSVAWDQNSSGKARRFLHVGAPANLSNEMKAQFLARGFEFVPGLRDKSQGVWRGLYNKNRKMFALDAFRSAELPPMSKAEERKYQSFLKKFPADHTTPSNSNQPVTNSLAEKGELDELARTTGESVLSSEALADIYSRMATGLMGAPRRVILEVPKMGSSGFATDMKGTIWAHPYPLGLSAPARNNMVVTRAGLEHELGHELYTPMGVWQRVLDVAEKKENEKDLGEKGAGLLPHCFNIVEDGRMEREIALHNAGS